MTAARFLLDPLPVSEDVVLGGAEGRHAATVRRVSVGEQIVIGDGRGRFRPAEVVAVGRDTLTLRCEPVQSVPAADPRLVVVQALPKGDRAELAVELLTELGVDEIVPWAAQRSIPRWRGERAVKSRQRWLSAAREAGKQSRRAWFPVIGEPADMSAVVDLIVRSAVAFTLHEQATAPLVAAALPGPGDTGDIGVNGGIGVIGDIVVIVGPEGGVSPEEVEAFEAAGARSVRLGEPVLRTSSAGAAALAVLSARLGRWG